MLLEDRVMVVTGGNSGIGEGIVREAVREGAAVVIDHVSNKDHADELTWASTSSSRALSRTPAVGPVVGPGS